MFTVRKPVICILLSICLLLLSVGLAYAQFSEVSGHWAEQQITSWINKGFIKGYPDGKFKPDNDITRAEFITLVNKSFELTESSTFNFKDVSASDWFYGEIGKAVAAGYINGYPDGTLRPKNKITRQEAAVIVARILKLDDPDLSVINKFTDAKSIPEWSKASIAAVVAEGLMNGYPDQTYRPGKFITRAEAVSTLDRAIRTLMKDFTYDAAGVYGPAEGTQTIQGNVIVNVPDVTLQNLVIEGNLTLAEGVGEGNVTLKNVTVKGDTIIKGGGSNSVILEDCNMGNIIVTKEGVRVVATGNTSVRIVTLESGATLVEVTITGEGFEQVVVTQEVPADTKIILEGNFQEVTVSAKVEVEVKGESSVGTLILNEAASVTGEGTIDKAVVNASGATITQEPSSITLAPNTSVVVAGESKSNTTSNPVTITDGTTGGGGGGGAITQLKVTQASILYTGGSVAAVINPSGTSGTVDLSDKNGGLMITGFAITAPGSSNLKITRIEADYLDLDLNEDITLPGTIEVSDLFGASKTSIALSTMRALLGTEFTLYGELTGSGLGPVDVTLRVILLDAPAVVDYSNEYADITYNVNTMQYEARIKAGKQNVKLADIGIGILILDTIGELPQSVRVNSDWYNISQANAIKNAIAADVGKAWDNVELIDLANKTYGFKKSGDPDTFELKFLAP